MDGPASPPSRFTPRDALEMAFYAVALVGIVAAVLGAMNRRAESVVAGGAEATAEVVSVVRKHTRTDRDGYPAGLAYLIDIRWSAGASGVRAAAAVKISDGYARRIGVGETGRLAKPTVRVFFRPDDERAPVVLPDDRDWLNSVPSDVAFAAAGLLTPLGVAGAFVMRRRRSTPAG